MTQPRVRRWLKLFGLIASLLALLTFVPLRPWIPSCGDRLIWGDLRDIYVDMVVAELNWWGVYHWRVGDIVLYRLLPFADREGFVEHSAFLNVDKIVPQLAEDVWIDGWLYPPPPRVAELLRELEPVIGPDPRQRPDGVRVIGDQDTRIIAHCELYRATILEPAPPRR